MAPGIHRLKPREVATLGIGMHPDGAGLYLQVRAAKGGGFNRSWLYRYRVKGRGDRQMGLGPAHTVSLAEAREKARLARLDRLDGIDPIEARKLARDRAAGSGKDFKTVAEEWLAQRAQIWTPHWLKVTHSRLERFAYSKFSNRPIEHFDMAHDGHILVQQALEPLWRRKDPIGERKGASASTGKSLQENIEGVLALAIARRYISGDNAASLKGPLGDLLPPLKDVLVREHHAALPYKEVPAFVAQLRAFEDIRRRRKDFKEGEVSKATMCQRRYRERHYKPNRSTSIAEKAAIEFLILTAVRKKMSRMVRWEDILEGGIWICKRHKTNARGDRGKDYVVPLSRQAMAILDRMREFQETNGIKNEHVFLGRFSRPLGHNTLNGVLQRMLLGNSKAPLSRSGLTIHGFRTSFGDWSVETGPSGSAGNGWDERDSEMALGHRIGDGVRNTYKRNAKRIGQRRHMMQAWADFIDRTELPAEVIPFRQAK